MLTLNDIAKVQLFPKMVKYFLPIHKIVVNLHLEITG